MNFDIFKNPTVTWFIIGVVLLLIELAAPGLVLLFFGAGAWVVALICLFADISLSIQILIFILASSISLALLRKYLRTQFFKQGKGNVSTEDDEFAGQKVPVLAPIKPGVPGKVEFKGTQWTAMSDVEIDKGEIVEIIDKQSINLIVKPTK